MKSCPKPKKRKLKAYKKDAWEAFSKWIRTRDCLATTGTTEQGKCCTCGKIYPFKQLQAGHWLPGRHSSVLFDYRNAHAQCYHCNIGLKGNPIKYYHFMNKKYGLSIMDELERLDAIVKSFKIPELQEIENCYRIINSEDRKNEQKTVKGVTQRSGASHKPP